MTKSEKFICGFIPVFLSSLLWPSLPQISLIGFAVLILIFLTIFKLPVILIGMLGGFIWASVAGYWYIDWQLGPNLYHQNLMIEGEVLSLLPPIKIYKNGKEANIRMLNQDEALGNNIKGNIPPNIFTHKRQLKFNFEVHKAGTKSLLFSPKVRLSWFAANLPLQQGDKVRLFVKLKPATGLANPDGFDYQTWLTSKNIVALGYVKNSPSNQLMETRPTLRQRWVNSLQTHNLTHLKWILALSYGDRRLLEKEDWALMQRTGTAHLFAISGMHLGIVFGCVLLVNKGMAFLLIVTMRKPIVTNVKPLLLVAPCIVCILYALIAGFEIPVLRALFTLLLWTAIVTFARNWRTPSVLLLLLLSFFVLFPFSILGISFWFSFISVLIIVFYIWRFPLQLKNSIFHKVIYGLKLQVFISLITLPIIAYTFSTLPIVAIVANLFMIPIVTFILVPFCLLAAIVLSLGADTEHLYFMINECFDLTFWVLTRIDSITGEFLVKNWEQTNEMKALISWLTDPLFIIAIMLLLVPAWPRKKWLVLSIIGLAISHRTIQSNFLKSDFAWTFYAFDVGQGTGLVLQDKLGTILMDTGGSFAGFSMANSVLIPFFEANNIDTLDYAILSHFDNDHAGGIDIITQQLKVLQVLSPLNNCNREQFLQKNPLGKATFLTLTVQILWPLRPNSGDENDQSCVIKFQKGKHSILLTGDIEKSVEEKLIALYKGTNLLNANVLVAPHHGSKTSSTQNFVNAVAPEIVIFTSGNHNRWGFPSQAVVQRYQAMNAEILNTGKHGRIKLQIDNNRIVVSKYREDEYKRWFYNAH